MRSADDERMPPAELLRSLVRDHLAERERRAFEALARRQSLAIAARVRDPNGDEARVMHELDAALEDETLGAEWKA